MSDFIYHSNASGADLHNPKGATVTDDIITFNNFPITPSSAPTTDYQVANKKYVDDQSGGGAGANTVLSNLASVAINIGIF